MAVPPRSLRHATSEPRRDRQEQSNVQNVVVGVDEPGSRHDALALAKQLTREDGRLTVAHRLSLPR